MARMWDTKVGEESRVTTLCPSRVAIADPPNVVPCEPGVMCFATSSFTIMAPMGKPLASGLAMVTMSG